MKFISHIIHIILGLGVGIMGLLAFPELFNANPATGFAIMILILLLAFFLQIIVHESGHLVFGLLSGYKFLSFRIGSLHFEKQQDKIKARLYGIVGTGGQCLMTPPLWSENFPYKLYNLGGVIFNAVFGVLSLLVYLLIGPVGAHSLFFGAFGLVGLCHAVLNGIPYENQGIANDGKNLVLLKKSEKSRRAFWLQLYANSLQTGGERLSRMPKEWFFLPEGEDLKDPMICTVGMFRYQRQFDAGEYAEAEEIAEYMLKAPGLLGFHKNELLCEQLFLRILREAPPQEIEPLFTKELKRYLKATEGYISRRRLQYAYQLLYKKDPHAAAKELKRFEEAVKVYGTNGEVYGEIEAVELIKSKAQVFC